MATADNKTYLKSVVHKLNTQWPDNEIVTIACHGHSVPAGYFATPYVDTFNAYPHLLHRALKERYPYAVVNVTLTAVGGEDSSKGAQRFESQVLCHHPHVVTIDYGLNDRRIGLDSAGKAWRFMIEKALSQHVRVILLTPTWDTSGLLDPSASDWTKLLCHTEQIRNLASIYSVGLVDSFAAFDQYVKQFGDALDLLSVANHPNEKGHTLVAEALMRWF